jgi:hypothetical protein
MGDEGQIFVNEGTSDEGNLVCELPASVLNGLNLFDESRLGFEYSVDGWRCAMMLSWQLKDLGYSPTDKTHFWAAVKQICEPGGNSTGGAIVNLDVDDLSNEELSHAEVLYDGTETKQGKKISMRQLYEMGLVTATEVRNENNPKRRAL